VVVIRISAYRFGRRILAVDVKLVGVGGIGEILDRGR
jgi:hypothetical protein